MGTMVLASVFNRDGCDDPGTGDLRSCDEHS